MENLNHRKFGKPSVRFLRLPPAAFGNHENENDARRKMIAIVLIDSASASQAIQI